MRRSFVRYTLFVIASMLPFFASAQSFQRPSDYESCLNQVFTLQLQNLRQLDEYTNLKSMFTKVSSALEDSQDEIRQCQQACSHSVASVQSALAVHSSITTRANNILKIVESAERGRLGMKRATYRIKGEIEAIYQLAARTDTTTKTTE